MISFKHGGDVNILRVNDAFLYPCFTSFTKCNGKYYGNRFDRNGLCTFDFERGIVHVVKLYDSVAPFAEWQYGALIAVKDVLYSIPLLADYIAIYSLEKRTIQKILLDDSKLIAGNAKFDEAFLVDNNIWLVPKSCFCVAKLDVLTNNINYYDGMETILSGECYEKWPHVVRKSIYCADSIYIMLWESNCLIKFDTINKKYTKLNIGGDRVIIRDISSVGKKIVLYCSNGKVYCLYDGKLTSICQLENNDNPKSMIVVGDDVWVVDLKNNSLAVINIYSKSGDTVSVSSVHIDQDIHSGSLWFDGMNKVYILPIRECRQTVSIDKNDFSTNKKLFKISDKDEMLYRELIKKENMFYENNINLGDFLDIRLGYCK